MKLKVIVHAAEEGGYWAEVPALKGCVSQGETIDETLFNVREATLGWLETAERRYRTEENVQLMEIQLFHNRIVS